MDPLFQCFCLPSDVWADVIEWIAHDYSRCGLACDCCPADIVYRIIVRFGRQGQRKQVLLRKDAGLIRDAYTVMMRPMPAPLVKLLRPLEPY